MMKNAYFVRQLCLVKKSLNLGETKASLASVGAEESHSKTFNLYCLKEKEFESSFV